MRRSAALAGGGLVLLALVAAAQAGDAPPAGDDPGDAAHPVTATLTPDGAGVSVRDGRVQFHVAAPTCSRALIPGEREAAVPAGRFCTFHIAVTNHGNTSVALNGNHSSLHDDRGQVHGADVEASLNAGDADAYVQHVEHGAEGTMVLVYDLPADAEPRTLVVRAAADSPGATVVLAGRSAGRPQP